MLTDQPSLTIALGIHPSPALFSATLVVTGRCVDRVSRDSTIAGRFQRQVQQEADDSFLYLCWATSTNDLPHRGSKSHG